MNIMAIDPGLKGGVAVFVDGELKALHTMPWRTFQMGNAKPRRMVNVHPLRLLVEQYGITDLVIERPIAMPAQSSTSTATTFLNFGLLLSLYTRCEVHVVEPRVWKKAWNLGNDKMEAIKLARMLTNKMIDEDGVAEAVLIGQYWIDLGWSRESSQRQARREKAHRRRSWAARKAARTRKAKPSSSAVASSRTART